MRKIAKSNDRSKASRKAPARPSRENAEEAVRTLLRWAGDDPEREGLLGTPGRVVRAYEEWFAGYFEDPRDYLKRTFEEVAGYDEIVLLRDIRFESHCEHHIAPIIGRVHIAYMPRNRVVGISKLARLVDVYAKRLQVQEKMTAEIAACVDSVLKPYGVAVVVEGAHRMHDHARRAQIRRLDGDQPHAGRVPRQSGNPAGVLVGDQPAQRRDGDRDLKSAQAARRISSVSAR